MNKPMAIALASLAALTLTSCNKPPEEPQAEAPATPVPAVEATTTPATKAGQDGLNKEVFTSPDGVLITEANSETQVPGLIPSTDPNLRIKAIGQGRQDPFTGTIIRVRPLPPDPATLGSAGFGTEGGFSGAGGSGTSAQGFSTAGPSAFGIPGSSASSGLPRGTTARSAGGSSSVGNNTPSRGASTTAGSQMSAKGSSGGSSKTAAKGSSGGSSKTAAKGSSGGSSKAAAKGGSSGGGKVAAGTSSRGGKTGTTSGSAGSGAKTPQIAIGPGNLPDLTPHAPIPDPALARAVEVTGVIQIGSSYQAIVKAADEPTSRYVSVGQRLSNGRVLVKRIESNGSEPVVILEEGGVEVVRAIGAPVEGEADKPQATAALPVPPSSI